MPCCCSSPAATALHFNRKRAAEELRSYRESGPAVTTRGLLQLILRPGSPVPRSVLDIGSGLGALSFGLLAAGVERATCVDIAPASLAAGAEEAGRQGVAGRIQWVNADFVAVAETLPAAELVTLDRVVCCYPDFAPLLARAAERTKSLLALSYPRARWTVRLVIWLENFWRRLWGDAFRAFVHPPAAFTELLRARGLTLTRAAATWTWRLELWSAAADDRVRDGVT